MTAAEHYAEFHCQTTNLLRCNQQIAMMASAGEYGIH